MKTTIDKAGRIVVPKSVRVALGLTGGQEVELVARDGRLEIDVAPTPMHLETRGRHVVAVAERDVPELTARIVRETLEQSRH